MPVVRVDALCECEGCQKRFGVELELAADLKNDFPDDFDGMAREEIMSGNGAYYVWSVRGKATIDRAPLPYQPTIQADLMLCDECSKKCDALPIDRNLTRAEVNQALGLPSGRKLTFHR